MANVLAHALVVAPVPPPDDEPAIVHRASSPPASEARPVEASAHAAEAASATDAKEAAHVAQAAPTPPTPEQIALLRRRGDDRWREGDIAAARLFYERAAEAGDVAAMRALARTYDPQALREIGAVGMSADADRAQHWLRRADEAAAAAAVRR